MTVAQPGLITLALRSSGITASRDDHHTIRMHGSEESSVSIGGDYDAFLCAIQATWAWIHRESGFRALDPLED